MNTDDGDLWKINRIPALEYCSLNRASELLNCKTCDLLHWAEIGAIELCLTFNGFDCAIDSLGFDDYFCGKKSFSVEWLNEQRKAFGGFMMPFHIGPERISIYSPFFDLKTDEGRVSGEYRFDGDDDFSRPLVRLYGLWALCLDVVSNPYSLIRNNGSVTYDALNFNIKSADGNDDFPALYVSPPRSHLYRNGGLIGKPETIITITLDDLWITRAQLEKVWFFIGKTFPSFVNGGVDENFLRKSHERLDNEPQRKSINVTAKQSSMIAALLQAIDISVDMQGSDSAEHLLMLITNKLSDKGIPTPDVTTKSLDTWLKKAGTRT
ncbi:hypothetical protein [Edwardsiella tarda]|uniref:hypothetical protein n=1 Tax=Edwardsiella TaxID=635 RepID=UPI00351C4DF6